MNKVKLALKEMENVVKRSSKKIKVSTAKLKKCSQKIKLHVSKLKEIRDALIKNKSSTNMMVHEGYIENVEQYTEHINGLFNSLIRSAENILED